MYYAMHSFCDVCFATCLLLYLCCVCRSNLRGRFRFMGDKKRTSSSSPSALDSHLPFMTSTAHVLPELCWRLFLSPFASFQRQTEKEKSGHSDILRLIPTASSFLCTPTTSSSIETPFSVSWHVGDICSSLRSSLFVLLLSNQKQSPVLS